MLMVDFSKDCNNKFTSNSKIKEPTETKMGSTILLMDSDGLSNYTCYLARGLSKYRDVILYGFSEEAYAATGVGSRKENKVLLS